MSFCESTIVHYPDPVDLAELGIIAAAMAPHGIGPIRRETAIDVARRVDEMGMAAGPQTVDPEADADAE